jgi:sigma-B regulation protein RsbU (phosphoserine phosphatase)
MKEAELGGDFYDVFSLGDGRTVIVMADVIGKGLRAAIMGAFTKFVIHAFLREGLGLSQTVERINSASNQEYGADLFVTAFIGVLDEKSGALKYVNAGHPGPLHVSTEEAVVLLEAASMPLGIFPEQEFAEGEIVLKPGEFLVLYTDGLYECLCEAEATPETIAREVREMLPTDVDTLVEALLARAEDRSNGVLNDDVAVLALRRSATLE